MTVFFIWDIAVEVITLLHCIFVEFFKFTRLVGVSSTNNREDHRIVEHENEEEYQKGLQIVNDSEDHRYDVTKRIKYSQVEKCFHDLLHQDNRDQDLVVEVVKVGDVL